MVYPHLPSGFLEAARANAQRYAHLNVGRQPCPDYAPVATAPFRMGNRVARIARCGDMCPVCWDLIYPCSNCGQGHHEGGRESCCPEARAATYADYLDMGFDLVEGEPVDAIPAEPAACEFYSGGCCHAGTALDIGNYQTDARCHYAPADAPMPCLTGRLARRLEHFIEQRNSILAVLRGELSR